MSTPIISGIILNHGKDDYGLWEGFTLTDEEESSIWQTLNNHDTEGCSVRGSRNDIAKEIGSLSIKEPIINYLQSMLNEFKKREERYGIDSEYTLEFLHKMIACKEMAEDLIKEPVNLGKNGIVTTGF